MDQKKGENLAGNVRKKAAMQKESMAKMADIHSDLKGNTKPKVKKHLDRANVYKKNLKVA